MNDTDAGGAPMRASIVRTAPLIVGAMLCAAALTAQDTIVIRADNSPLWGAAPRLVEELRIGVVIGDPLYEIGHVAGLAVDANGNIWISDQDLDAIRRYSASGVHLGDIGREGDGPGEFRYVEALALVRDGSVAAWDPRIRRVSVFDHSGELVSEFSVPVSGIVGLAGARDLQTLASDTLGRLYVADRRRDHIFWHVLAPNGQVIDSLPRPLSNQEGFGHPIVTRGAVGRDGSLIEGRGDRYSFVRHLRDGRVARIERSEPAAGYARGERDEVQSVSDYYSVRNGVEPRSTPPTKPFWSSFQVDVEGRIWVERYGEGVSLPESDIEPVNGFDPDSPAVRWTQPVVFDVIGPQGQFFGTLRFPHRTGPYQRPTIDIKFARGSLIWTVERGQFDEEYVVRYRIEPGG